MEWVKPNDLEEGLFVRLTGDARPASFVIAGSKRSQPFDTEERVELLRGLVPHLQQALSTQHYLTALAERAQNFAEAVDRVPQGIVIVAQDMHIVECNSAALRILSEGDGLGVLNGALSASMPNSRRNLHSLAYQALTSEGVRSGGSGTARISGKRAYVRACAATRPRNSRNSDKTASRGAHRRSGPPAAAGRDAIATALRINQS